MPAWPSSWRSSRRSSARGWAASAGGPNGSREAANHPPALPCSTRTTPGAPSGTLRGRRTIGTTRTGSRDRADSSTQAAGSPPITSPETSPRRRRRTAHGLGREVRQPGGEDLIRHRALVAVDQRAVDAKAPTVFYPGVIAASAFGRGPLRTTRRLAPALAAPPRGLLAFRPSCMMAPRPTVSIRHHTSDPPAVAAAWRVTSLSFDAPNPPAASKPSRRVPTLRLARISEPSPVR